MIPPDKARHARRLELAERVLAPHQPLAAAKAPHERTVLQGQIAATDRRMYERYGLTEKEIKIVEECS